MIEQADRIEALRRVVERILCEQQDKAWRRVGWIHLYGVAQTAAMLALRRGVDVELAMAAGMLHDVATCQSGDATDHAERGALLAEDILNALDRFSANEISAICRAVAHHSDKRAVDAPLDEVLKDADVLQFYLYHPRLAPLVGRPWRDQRLKRLQEELGLADSPSRT